MKTVIDRVSDVEKLVVNLQKIVEAKMEFDGQTAQRLASIARVLNAVTDVVGSESVSAKMTEQIEKEKAEQLLAAKSELTDRVTSGQLVSASVATGNSLLVGREYDKDGKVVNDWVRTDFASVAPEYQEKLLNQPVGTKFTIGEMGQFELVEIYDPAPPAAAVVSPSTLVVDAEAK